MENAILKIGDVVTFYDKKCTVTKVKKINENTFEYTLDDKYTTIQESDWSIDRWDNYTRYTPYHIFTTLDKNKINLYKN